MDSLDSDVVIVGAGPTGLMLASELRLAGVRALVLERRIEPMQQSRALGFSARTIEEFDQRGLLPQFGELQTIPVGHFGGLTLDFRIMENGSYGARGVPQSVTESILAKRATGLGADIRRGWEVVDLATDDSGVEVSVAGPEGEQQLRARYVVGCDGGRSTVRKRAGIDFPGTEPTMEMWLADVTGCELRPRFAGERLPGGMVMVLPMGPDTSRVVLYERAAALRDTQDPPTFAEVAAAWQRLTGEDINHAEPLWVSWFTDSSRQASEYRRGRVMVAGDAAHVHMPIGAQGMSGGIQDAVNLGWKLAAEIHGHAPPGLLDTYHTERHPVGARVLANTLAQRLLYLSGDEMQPLRDIFGELMEYDEVQQHLVGMITGFDIRYDMGAGEHPLLGRRVPDRGLKTDGSDAGESTIFRHLHQARPVLFDFADDARAGAAAAPWRDRVDVVHATCEVDGADPLAGVAALLVRPDGYVAWASDDGGSEGLPEALTRWLGAPAAGH